MLFCFRLFVIQVAVYLRTVGAVTTGHGAPGMTSSLVENTALSVGPAGLAEIA